MLEKILMLNTLKNQHIINPLDDVNCIVRDAIGIQAQYLNNALFAISIRHKNMHAKLDASVVRKIWSFRGTLHLHSVTDINAIVSILRNDWYTRWGKYMSCFFSDDVRNRMKEQTCHFIELGVCNRHLLRDECVRLGYDINIVNNAFSSWGGILKDLNYDGQIYFTEYDKANFSLNNENLLDEKTCFSFGTELAKRYFSFYGPATLSDFCHWVGISKSICEQWLLFVEKELSYLMDEKKQKYYYIGKLNENINELPTCVFLGGFDPLMLAYKNKSRWLKSEYQKNIFLKNGFVRNIILLDGMADAIWKLDKGVLKITLFEPTSKKKDIISNFIESSNVLACKSVVYSN